MTPNTQKFLLLRGFELVRLPNAMSVVELQEASPEAQAKPYVPSSRSHNHLEVSCRGTGTECEKAGPTPRGGMNRTLTISVRTGTWMPPELPSENLLCSIPNILEGDNQVNMAHTVTLRSKMNRNLKHCKTSCEILRTRTKWRDPMFSFQIRMQRARTFVSHEVRNKVDRFVLPKRCLVLQWEGDFDGMECHNSLDKNQGLRKR